MTSTDPFSDPAQPSSIEYPELQGSLLMFEVLSHEDHVPTVHTAPGERNPAIRANVTVIDGPKAPYVFEDALIFPKVLQSQLRSRIGRRVLGRLGQGEQQPGKTAPWRLEAATEDDKRRATAALSSASGTSATPRPTYGGPTQSEPPF